MKMLEELYRDLENYKNFDADPENAEKFLETVDAIVLKKDPTSIPVLLKYFDDSTKSPWVLESLMIQIENYSIPNHIKSFFEAIEYLISKAPSWSIDIANRILNDEKCIITFKQNMHGADRAALLKLFDIMETESPHHTELIQELRTELLAKS